MGKAKAILNHGKSWQNFTVSSSDVKICEPRIAKNKARSLHANKAKREQIRTKINGSD